MKAPETVSKTPPFVATTCYDDDEVTYFNEGSTKDRAYQEFLTDQYLEYLSDNSPDIGENIDIYIWTTIRFEESYWVTEGHWVEGDEKPFQWCLDELIETRTKVVV